MCVCLMYVRYNKGLFHLTKLALPLFNSIRYGAGLLIFHYTMRPHTIVFVCGYTLKQYVKIHQCIWKESHQPLIIFISMSHKVLLHETAQNRLYAVLLDMVFF